MATVFVEQPIATESAPTTPARGRARRPIALGTPATCSIEIDDATGLVPGGLVAWISERAQAAAKHLGDPSTTDVMTFDMADGAAARTGALDADVLVCLDEAGRQAVLRRHGVQLEILLYVVHAMLHCVGYDDGTRAGARAMHAREDEVLSAIGVGVVYHAGDHGASGQGGDGAGGRS